MLKALAEKHYHVLEMVKSDLEELKKSQYTKGKDKEFIGMLRGGEVPIAFLIAHFIGMKFDAIIINAVESCGVIPFLRFPKKNRYITDDFYYHTHSMGTETHRRLNAVEMDEHKKYYSKANEIIKNLFKINGATNEAIKWLDKVLYSANDVILLAEDMVRFNLVEEDHVIKYNKYNAQG